MAGYSIVLNLSGNAVSNSLKLATNLERANVAAKSLMTTLPVIGRTMGNMRGFSSGQLRAMGDMEAKRIIAQARAASISANSEERRQRRIRNVDVRRGFGQTTHSRSLHYGTGFRFGGLTGRFQSIFRPDENGMLLGMNASKLMRNINVAAIAGNIMTSIGKTLLKASAALTLAPFAISGGVMMVALRALQSESFAEGVRLISRRHQARLGLGSEYEAANSNADYLAMSYGLDRSTTLSSLNVMTGLGVGGGKRKLSLGEATDLTKVGGIISQHHGVPFERVMTNIQQLLVQNTPHMRDIRELLNQAPILGKYALREMESRGIEGVDTRTYLKDQRNILSVLKSYELDTATNAGMQARGRIGLAQQDAMATVASNDPFWRMIGEEGSRLIKSIGGAVNNLMTSLANNPEFRVMLRNLSNMVDNFGTKGTYLIDKLITLVDGLIAKYDLADLGDKRKARVDTAADEVISKAIVNPYMEGKIRKIWDENNQNVGNTAEQNDKAFRQWVRNEFVGIAKNDKDVREGISGVGEKLDATSNYGLFQRTIMNFAPQEYAISTTNREAVKKTTADASTLKRGNLPMYVHVPKINNLSEPSYDYGAYTLPDNKLLDAARKAIEERTKVGKLDPTTFPTSGDGSGSDLKGFNRDRRSLEIHFHDKIIEWNSTIVSNNPTETVEEVADNIEQLTSAGLQKALLGASSAMSSRWY